MRDQWDVVIVSAFGRGHWLASELSERGKKVALIDVSHGLGRWAPEDWEGPFGFFHSERLSASQIERLSEDDYHDPVDQGFVLWLKEGPVDMKGPLSSYWMNQLGLCEEVGRYLGSYNNLDTDMVENLKDKMLERPFTETWFAHLCHQLASTTYTPNADGLQSGRPLSVMSPLNLRRATRKGFEKSLSWCESKGVHVYRNAEVMDAQVENSKITQMEIRSDWSGTLRGTEFVWQLTSEESFRVSDKVANMLYPNGPVKSTWGWMRYRIQLEDTPTLSSLPNQFVILKDIFLPWTHDNLLLVQKTVRSENFDVWVRIPTQLRFQRSYLENINRKILEEFSKKIPGSSPVNVDMPQDYLYEDSELGPPRHPVYAEEDLAPLKRTKLSNVDFDSPENWVNLDWLGQFDSQTKIKHSLLEKN